ncbi:hypothetical protein K469DRAFT_149445 [Zopfia rhizophila CBS 207.26]|uniref:Uncharacterized protein n=1 Tax=Zopfia rhizophila CBS 207.26 TaxID=1314779 RepID=A0A6A6E763_9PEZI|nr:hypothetical protein K469DRAFT_149445 [Zopfia rhizophila CBS 207.26]
MWRMNLIWGCSQIMLVVDTLGPHYPLPDIPLFWAVLPRIYNEEKERRKPGLQGYGHKVWTMENHAQHLNLLESHRVS